MRKFLLSLSFIFCIFSVSYGQNKFELKIISANGSCFTGKKEVQAKDSVSVLKYLSSVLNELHSEGFLSASFDSVLFLEGNVKANLFCGDKYSWISLGKGNVPENYLSRTGYRERFFVDKPFKPAELGKIQHALVREAENSGFPFARVVLDSITILKNQISGKLNFDPGPEFKFDSVIIEGPVKIKKAYLMRHLRISEGDPFSQETFENISALIKKLPFLQEARPAGLEFFGDKAKIILYLKPRKVNQVDVLAGLLPNQGPENKTIFTGEANLVLHNLFLSGKRVNSHWRRYDINSQVLEIGYFHPKIFGSILDVSANLDLLKQDTLFMTINRNLSLGRQNSGGRVFVGVNRSTSRTLGEGVSGFVDFNYTSYSLGFSQENLDDPFFPRTGWFLSGECKVGSKKIMNQDFTEDIPLQSLQVSMYFKGATFLKVSQRISLVSILNTASIMNNQSALFANDLFRVGGLKTLRGFNENFYYSSSYAVATAEARLYPDEETYLFLFYDQGYIFNPFSIIEKEDMPFGTGAGISFSSNAGIFNFAWSLGKSSVQPLTFNNSKIHFGYITRF